jgi:hypothetical protein
MFCPKCSKVIENSDDYCRHCGKAVANAAAVFETYTSPDGMFTLEIPSGWQVHRQKIGVDQFVVENPSSRGMYVWKWPAVQYFDPRDPSSQFAMAYTPSRELFIVSMSAIEYLKRMALPRITQLSGEIQVIKEGPVDDPGCASQGIDLYYCDYDRRTDGMVVRGRVIAMTHIYGNGLWLGVAGGFEARSEEFEINREMLQKILNSYKLGPELVAKQQQHQKEIQRIQSQAQADITRTIQDVVKNRQDAMDRAFEKWKS